MSKTVKPTGVPLSHKLVAAWLKYDPLVRLVARDNEQIRYDAMLALAGKNAARHFFAIKHKFTPPPRLIYPHDVRKKELEFFEKPDSRSRIIRELVYWATDDYLNSENPDSHNTRIQIVHSLLGPLFVSSPSSQEQIIVEGVKVLVVSPRTHQSRLGEQSPLVHQEILRRVCDLLHYNQLVLSGKQQAQSEVAARANLLKTIQGLNDSSHRAGYYLSDHAGRRRRTLVQKFPLCSASYAGLVAILRHYTFSAWPQFRSQAQKTLGELGAS